MSQILLLLLLLFSVTYPLLGKKFLTKDVYIKEVYITDYVPNFYMITLSKKIYSIKVYLHVN